jgi:hypothetical protein
MTEFVRPQGRRTIRRPALSGPGNPLVPVDWAAKPRNPNVGPRLSLLLNWESTVGADGGVIAARALTFRTFD